MTYAILMVASAFVSVVTTIAILDVSRHSAFEQRLQRLESRPMSSDRGHTVDKFSEELEATVRDCLNCGALVVGGPSRCCWCARSDEPELDERQRIAIEIQRAGIGAIGSTPPSGATSMEWDRQCARCGSSVDDVGCLSSSEWCGDNPLDGRADVPRGSIEFFRIEEEKM